MPTLGKSGHRSRVSAPCPAEGPSGGNPPACRRGCGPHPAAPNAGAPRRAPAASKAMRCGSPAWARCPAASGSGRATWCRPPPAASRAEGRSAWARRGRAIGRPAGAAAAGGAAANPSGGGNRRRDAPQSAAPHADAVAPHPKKRLGARKADTGSTSSHAARYGAGRPGARAGRARLRDRLLVPRRPPCGGGGRQGQRFAGSGRPRAPQRQPDVAAAAAAAAEGAGAGRGPEPIAAIAPRAVHTARRRPCPWCRGRAAGLRPPAKWTTCS